MERGTDQGYFTDPAKLIFISDIPDQEGVAKRDFVEEGLELNFVSSSRYLWAYLSPQEDLVE